MDYLRMLDFKAKSPLQRAFPGFPYNLLVVVGDRVNMISQIYFTIINLICQENEGKIKL